VRAGVSIAEVETLAPEEDGCSSTIPAICRGLEVVLAPAPGGGQLPRVHGGPQPPYGETFAQITQTYIAV
jgi:hypothetical protein